MNSHDQVLYHAGFRKGQKAQVKGNTAARDKAQRRSKKDPSYWKGFEAGWSNARHFLEVKEVKTSKKKQERRPAPAQQFGSLRLSEKDLRRIRRYGRTW